MKEDSGQAFSWSLTPGDAGKAATEPAAAPAPPVSHATPPETAIDRLFGDSQFQPFDERIAAPPTPSWRRPASTGARGAPPQGLSRGRKTLIGVVTAFVAALALVALFFLGTRLPTLLASSIASQSPTPSHTPSLPAKPTPTPALAPVAGPVAVGVHGWNELRGGECLNPYTSPWVERFTVVDCAAAHPAQMVFRGTFDPATTPTFPGAAALQSKISLLCAAPGVLDLAAASQYSDAQMQGAYPVTEAEWMAGQHDYFCFISRSSGQPLTGSVAAAKAP